MSTLITGDLHFTDNPRDEYRWGLLPWLCEQVKELKVDNVVLLGDITDAKDRHSAVLVNRLVEQLKKLEDLCYLFILKGNHDYVDPSNPFLGFLPFMQVVFISQPYDDNLVADRCAVPVLFLPSTRDYKKDWAGIEWNSYKYIFCHQTFEGAESESGFKLDGIPPSVFKTFKGKVFSGDIHVPQRIASNIEYVGAPYRVRFGDDYRPRIIYLQKDGGTRDLHFPCLSKHVIVLRRLDDIAPQAKRANIKPKDQVKVRVRLKRSEYPTWPKLKEDIKLACNGQGWELFGPELLPLEEVRRSSDDGTPQVGATKAEDVVAQYAKDKKLGDELLSLGLSILKEASES